jgi:hypothetical protein
MDKSGETITAICLRQLFAAALPGDTYEAANIDRGPPDHERGGGKATPIN